VLPLNKQADKFQCEVCVAEVDSKLHAMECEKCNVRFHLMAELRRLLEYLHANLEDNANHEQLSRWIRPRLEKYDKMLRLYVAHKLRDAHMTESFSAKLAALKPHQGLALSDYAAKSRGMEADTTQAKGYGDKGAISRHVMTFYQKLRPEDAPDATEEDRGQMMLVTTFNLFSDNPKQNADHCAKQVRGHAYRIERLY